MDASDPKQVRQARKAARAFDRQRQEVIHNLMSSNPGRSFVYDLLEGCHTFASSFALNGLQMAFNEGERNQGLKLLGDIMRVCPDYYVLMVREYNERHNSHRTDSDGSTPGEQSGGEDGDGRDQESEPPDPHGYYRTQDRSQNRN